MDRDGKWMNHFIELYGSNITSSIQFSDTKFAIFYQICIHIMCICGVKCSIWCIWNKIECRLVDGRCKLWDEKLLIYGQIYITYFIQWFVNVVCDNAKWWDDKKWLSMDLLLLWCFDIEAYFRMRILWISTIYVILFFPSPETIIMIY